MEICQSQMSSQRTHKDIAWGGYVSTQQIKKTKKKQLFSAALHHISDATHLMLQQKKGAYFLDHTLTRLLRLSTHFGPHSNLSPHKALPSCLISHRLHTATIHRFHDVPYMRVDISHWFNTHCGASTL